MPCLPGHFAQANRLAMRSLKLSTDALLLILERIPLASLPPLCLVSRAWYEHILRLCGQKKCLVLRPQKPFQISQYQRTIDGPYISEFSHLQVADLENVETATSITAHFPAVVNLELYIKSINSGPYLANLMRLLKPWAGQLVRLQISVLESPFITSKAMVHSWSLLLYFLETKDLFLSLRTLIVTDANTRSPNPVYFCPIPQLPALEHLTFGFCPQYPSATSARLNRTWGNLRRFSQNSSCCGTLYSNIEDPKKKLISIFFMNRPQHGFAPCARLCDQLTHYVFDRPLEWSQHRRLGHFLSDCFSALTHLQVRTMVRLDLLVTRFRLYELSSLQFLAIVNQRCFDIVEPSATLPEEAQSQPVMPTITTLEIKEHLPVDSFAWARTMLPGLKRLNLIRTHCLPRSPPTLSENCRAKMEQLEEPFRQSLQDWPQLKVVECDFRSVSFQNC